MIIKEVTRTYSRSINTRNYGLLESWIKIESQYTAQVESGDDPVKVSDMLYEQAKSEVVTNINAIIEKIQQNRPAAPGSTGAPTAPLTPTGNTGPTPTAPVAPVTPAAPANPAPRAL